MKFSAALAAAALLLAGCNVIPPPTSDATRTYVLTGALPTAAGSGAPAAGSLRLGLKRVELSAYLDTRDMVVRDGANQIELQDFARWAEPLDAGISRLLQDQLAAAPAVGRVYAQPFAFEAERDYDVTVSVLRCEGGTAAGRHAVARFAAAIDVSTPGPASRLISHRVFVAPEAAWDGASYGQLAALLSDDVAALGREILSALPSSP